VLVRIPERVLALPSLPKDVQLVLCERDSSGKGIVLALRSKAFPELAPKEAVPEFVLQRRDRAQKPPAIGGDLP
jgi:hypothetical protein